MTLSNYSTSTRAKHVRNYHLSLCSVNIVKHFCMLMVYRCYIYNVSRCGGQFGFLCRLFVLLI